MYVLEPWPDPDDQVRMRFFLCLNYCLARSYLYCSYIHSHFHYFRVLQVQSQILAAAASGDVSSLISVVQSQRAKDVVPVVENKASASCSPSYDEKTI